MDISIFNGPPFSTIIVSPLAEKCFPMRFANATSNNSTGTPTTVTRAAPELRPSKLNERIHTLNAGSVNNTAPSFFSRTQAPRWTSGLSEKTEFCGRYLRFHWAFPPPRYPACFHRETKRPEADFLRKRIEYNKRYFSYPYVQTNRHIKDCQCFRHSLHPPVWNRCNIGGGGELNIKSDRQVRVALLVSRAPLSRLLGLLITLTHGGSLLWHYPTRYRQSTKES